MTVYEIHVPTVLWHGCCTSRVRGQYSLGLFLPGKFLMHTINGIYSDTSLCSFSINCFFLI